MIWITGGFSGLGLSVAQNLSSKYPVGIIGRRSPEREEIVRADWVSAYHWGDVEKYQDCYDFWLRCKNDQLPCNAIVLNVGSGRSVPPGRETKEEWERVFSKNFFSTTNMVESSSDYISQNKVRFICISSICGVEFIPGAPITYSVAKAALNFYVKLKQRDLSRFNCTINALALGNMIFPGSTWETKDADLVSDMLASEVCARRFGAPEDVSEFIEFLVNCSDFIQGKTFVHDGCQVRS